MCELYVACSWLRSLLLNLGGVGFSVHLFKRSVILSVRRVYPCFEVGDKVSLFLRNLELVAESLRERFLDVTGSNKIEKFRPEWLARDQLVQRMRFTGHQEK